MLVLLLCLVLAQLIAADTTITTNVDFAESIVRANTLKRTEIIVDVNRTFWLTGDNQYHDFPYMDIEFNIPFQQYVKVKYNVILDSNGFSYISFRVKVDGKENIEMRGYLTSTWDPSVFRYSEIFMSKGKHRIVAEYKTQNTRSNSRNERNSALLKVEYFQQAAP